MKKIVLTGGGTAGHVTPNIALLPALQREGFTVSYIGGKGIERSLITEKNVPFYCISTGKLRRYFDLKNLTDLFRIAAGFVQSFFILIRIRPSVVFSKGGFVSVPVVWASALLRIPVLIHESDITPGLANRLSIPFAKKICYSFKETASYLPENKRVNTGLPIRQELVDGSKDKGLELCRFTQNKPVLLIIGGSQGSVTINTIIRESLPRLLKSYNVCHLCGKGNLGTAVENYVQFEYVKDELAHLLAAADLVISRSGATTLFELLALQKPSLLIPLGAGSRGDQVLNARSFEKAGFSHVLLQDSLTQTTLIESIDTAFAQRNEMITAMKNCDASQNGTEKILSQIRSVVVKNS
ncbi:MAG TPA: undecaprenyldiphospho-muramoylpentapeptide beta-N-acetylglucosaminyltransferase [Chitinispirillaceae bacterium]|nr:undecaprenyldiphospho-muramoylpentapeptide beta-N-acetylglucosaminyltransferase [Chitinispirillaceae bacterium]